MSIIDNAKEIADLIKKIGDIELYRRIIELEGEILDLTKTKRDAETEIEKLKEIINTQSKMEFKKPFYFYKDDESPYCPKCWEVERIAIHLDGLFQSVHKKYYMCHNCKNTWTLTS